MLTDVLTVVLPLLGGVSGVWIAKRAWQPRTYVLVLAFVLGAVFFPGAIGCAALIEVISAYKRHRPRQC
jgi:hypothetical protein